MQWADRNGRHLRPRDLHIFLTVVEQGNMAKAANLLATSRPVVSKTIASLERALGVRLLDRSPQGVEPTLYGRALLRRSVTLFDELRQGIQEIKFLADPTTGELQLGCTQSIAAGFVQPSSTGSRDDIRGCSSIYSWETRRRCNYTTCASERSSSWSRGCWLLRPSRI